MNKQAYLRPEVEVIELTKGLNLLLNLSLDGNMDDFDGPELEDF